MRERRLEREQKLNEPQEINLKKEEKISDEQEEKISDEQEEKISDEQEEKISDEQEEKISDEQEEKISDEQDEKISDEQDEKRINGKVKWFNAVRGYGFIEREDKGKDVFVHLSAVSNSGLEHLKEGELLTFEVENTEKGLSAINLQKIS